MSKHQPVNPVQGLFHFERQEMGERSKIHLRIDQDGSGLLMVNANRILHLNPTAAYMAYLILNHTSQPQAIHSITHKYHVSPPQAERDYQEYSLKLSDLIRPDGPCPIHDMELDVIPPFSAHPSAPYRMDLAITYRCNNDCAHCYNARERNYPEISTNQWITILDRLWEIGIPHVVFTGGEPTLREDLPELVSHAQQIGQITGLNTNARRLSDKRYVDKLVDAGLDHAQVTLESHNPAIHDQMVNSRGAWQQTVAGLRNVLDSPLYVMTNTTMLSTNSTTMGETLDFLAELGVPTVGLNALIYSGRGAIVNSGLPEKDLHSLLELAREKMASHGQRLIWYTPTQYCHFDPMQLELGIKGCTAALYNMCIESNGDVIPCQSYYHSLGNMLTNSWESLWNHDLSVQLRERRYILEKCRNCALLSECGGGCPLKLQDENGQMIDISHHED